MWPFKKPVTQLPPWGQAYTFTKEGLESLCNSVKREMIAAMVGEDFIQPKDALLWDGSHVVLLRQPDQVSVFHDFLFDRETDKLGIYVAELQNLGVTDPGDKLLTALASLEGNTPPSEAGVMVPALIEEAEKMSAQAAKEADKLPPKPHPEHPNVVQMFPKSDPDE